MKRSYQSMTVVEEFRVIEGFPDYQVSNLGRVSSYKSQNKPILLKQTFDNNYLMVTLSFGDSKRTNKRVHRLVLIAFHINPDPKYYDLCDHINRNTLDNRASNLRWSYSVLNQLNKTGVRGYSFCKTKRKYRARLRKFGKDVELGYFSTSYLARLAYLEAKRIHLKLIDHYHHK